MPSLIPARLGFDKMISIGNMADVDFADLIEWLEEDENTACTCLYIEGIKDGRKFIEACRKAKKPIIALKAGTSTHGAAAAASHTGSLAGSAKVYNAAFQQAGVVQASDLNNLFDRTLALSLMPPLKGTNVLLVTNGGGVGVLATDAAEKYRHPVEICSTGCAGRAQEAHARFRFGQEPGGHDRHGWERLVL